MPFWGDADPLVDPPDTNSKARNRKAEISEIASPEERGVTVEFYGDQAPEHFSFPGGATYRLTERGGEIEIQEKSDRMRTAMATFNTWMSVRIETEDEFRSRLKSPRTTVLEEVRDLVRGLRKEYVDGMSYETSVVDVLNQLDSYLDQQLG